MAPKKRQLTKAEKTARKISGDKLAELRTFAKTASDGLEKVSNQLFYLTRWAVQVQHSLEAIKHANGAAAKSGKKTAKKGDKPQHVPSHPPPPWPPFS